MKTLLKLIAIFGAVAQISFPVSVFSAESQSDNPDPAQLARGAKEWTEQCGRCHNLRSPSELNDIDWEVAVTHMRIRGNIPGDVAKDIMAFLKASNKK